MYPPGSSLSPRQSAEPIWMSSSFWTFVGSEFQPPPRSSLDSAMMPLAKLRRNVSFSPP
jgi:hypothetical protein